MKDAVTITYPNKMSMLVDPCDVELATRYSWCRHCSGYAWRSTKDHENRTHIFFHRELLNPSPGEQVDHINGNKLDNRRSNLRICSHGENQMNSKLQKNNTTGFKGVRPHNVSGKFNARIGVGKKRKSLGYYNTAEEAHAAYCKAAKELHGEFFNPG